MMYTIADQAEDELGGRRSLFTRQRREHERLDVLLHKLGVAKGTDQDATLTEISRLVFPHAFAEESVIWPLARRVLPDGAALTLQIEQEHQQINELWAQLERTPHGDPTRQQLLDRLTELLREDVRDEEDKLFPQLQQALTTQQVRRAGDAWAAVRRIAPTRPHPVVARRPPGNVAAALPMTVLDRARDRLDAVSRSRTSRLSSAATRTSRVLASVAGRLEHVPPLPVGEDPSTSR